MTVQEGDKIRLLLMPDDPDPLPVGATGTVVHADDIQVWVKWDPPNERRGLNLIPGVDQFETI